MTIRDPYGMTTLELIEVLEDKVKCGACGSCKANYIENPNHKGSRFDCCTSEKLVISILKDRARELENDSYTPKENYLTENLLPYESTRKFMKSHGYHRCYMCGSELDEETSRNG